MLRLAELKKPAHSHGEVHSCLRLMPPANRDVNRRNASLDGTGRARFLSVAQWHRDLSLLPSFSFFFFFFLFFFFFFYISQGTYARLSAFRAYELCVIPICEQVQASSWRYAVMIGKPHAEQCSVLLRSGAVIYRLSKYFTERFRECEANANSAHLAALRDPNDRRCIIQQIRQRTYAPLWRRARGCGYARGVKKIEISNREEDVMSRKNLSSSPDISSRVVTGRCVICKAVKSDDSSFSTCRPSHAMKGLGLPNEGVPRPPRIRRRVARGTVRDRDSDRFFILPLV